MVTLQHGAGDKGAGESLEGGDGEKDSGENPPESD
jgi:hypothetical protein